MIGTRQKEKKEKKIRFLMTVDKAPVIVVAESAHVTAVTPPLLDLCEVEKLLGYEFKDKRLLEEAFTHVSYDPEGPEFNYERLEYVGDSVIGLLFANKHFRLYPELSTGTLTRLRANNVDTEKLARASLRHGLYRYLRHQKPLDEQIRLFGEGISQYPLHSNGLIDVPKALADIVESSVGAVFIDSDSSLEVAWKVCQNLLEPLVRPENLKIHPTSELLEICQKHNVKMRFEDLWEETARMNVYVNEEFAGTGCHAKKKEVAKCRAANDALPNVYRIIADKKAADEAGRDFDDNKSNETYSDNEEEGSEDSST